jgi:hypothetical protein
MNDATTQWFNRRIAYSKFLGYSLDCFQFHYRRV